MDYFKNLIETTNKKSDVIQVKKCEYLLQNNDYSFDLFNHQLTENSKLLYNTYASFELYWQSSVTHMRGFVHFVPYPKLTDEHEKLCLAISEIDRDVIENQNKVIEDIRHWFPVFLFPNGDKFCFDDRTHQILFYEHDVFDSGINLHGLLIAESIDVLLSEWSKLLFVDIYDWTEGVSDKGIDINKPIFDCIRRLSIH